MYLCNACATYMKYTTLISFLVAVLLLAGCYSDNKYISQLDAAEGLLDTAPDSALALLQEIDSHHLSRADNALYALLLSQARDKCYIDETNDSLINIAVEYYGDSKDKYREMLAYYYHGRVKYNAGEYAQSILSFLESEKYALKQSDDFYLGLIYRNISNIYDIIYWGEGAIEYAHKSYEAFSDTEHHRYTYFALLEVSTAHYKFGNVEESYATIQEVLKWAENNKDTILYYDAGRVLANIYIRKEAYHDALNIFEEKIKYAPELFDNYDYVNLSICYAMVGNLKNAQHYASYVAQQDSTKTWGLYITNRENNNYKEALKYLEKEIFMQNDALQSVNNQSVINAVKLFFEQEEYYKSQLEKKQRIFWITILSVLLIASIVALYARIRFEQNKVERNILLAQNLRNTLAVKNAVIQSLQQDINTLFAHQFKTIDDLCNVYYEYQDKAKAQTKVYNNVMDVINNIGRDSSTIEKMEQLVNAHLNNLMYDFRSDYPLLKEDDYKLFLYFVSGFSPRAISILLQVKIDIIYNRKSSLKRKISNNHNINVEKYLAHL